MDNHFRIERSKLLVINDFNSVYENCENENAFVTRKHFVYSDESPKQQLFEWYYELYPRGVNERVKNAFSLYLYINSIKIPKLSVYAAHYVRNKCGRFISSLKQNFSFETDNEINKVHGDATFFPIDYIDDYEFGDKFTIEATITFKFHHKSNSNNLPKYEMTCDLSDYFNKDIFSDVIISAGDEKYFGHKLILAARSSVFASMFAHGKNDVVFVKDSPIVIKQILEYIYLNEFPSVDTVSFGIFEAADKYGLEEFKDACQTLLENSLSTKNVFKRLKYAELHNVSRLKRKAMDFMKKNFKEIIKSTDWMSLMSSNLKLANEVINYVHE